MKRVAQLARSGGGIVLFAGAKGTGKTMAAEVVAGELGVDLVRVDLGDLMSKYIGETEKNLDRVFAAAKKSGAVLFIDEADVLFGKRSEVRNAHDRYDNIDIGQIVQKIEDHPGIVILASNKRKNLDQAFLRRLRFVVQFPYPEEPKK